MRLGLRALLVVMAMAGVGGIHEAAARPAVTTRYTYYTISGGNAVDLYNAMIRRGPHVNGAKAYASTSAASSQRGKLQPGKSCRVTDYRFSINFVIRLPKFANEQGLSAETRTRWRAFSAFLKQHEETHRSIWLRCGRELESQIAAIRAKDCATADRVATRKWEEMRTSCARRHAAFDATEQARLLRHPFVKLVLKSAARTSYAAAARSRKKKRNFVSSN